MQSLIDKSLLRATFDGRFFMLETIRAYAAERLDDRTDAEAMRRGHADYTLDLIGDSRAFNTERLESVDRWAPDILAAISWAHASRDHGREIQLLSRLDFYWRLRGLTAEARRWVEDAIDYPQSELDSGDRARALGSLVVHCGTEGDTVRANSAALEALHYARLSGDRELLLIALNAAGTASLSFGELERAQPLFSEAAAAARSLSSPLLPSVLLAQGVASLYAGQLEDAENSIREAQQLYQETDSETGAVGAAHNLGLVALTDGRYDQARQYFLDTLRGAAKLKFAHAAMYAHEGLAAVEAETGQFACAAELLGAADLLRDQIGAALEPFEQRVHDETMAAIEKHLDTVEVATALDRGRHAAVDDITASALGIEL
jgi:tetratricopeptide (TPR) repeat protein